MSVSKWNEKGNSVLGSCFLISKLIMPKLSFWPNRKLYHYPPTFLRNRKSIFKMILGKQLKTQRLLNNYIFAYISFIHSFGVRMYLCVFMKGMKETFIKFLYFWLLGVQYVDTFLYSFFLIVVQKRIDICEDSKTLVTVYLSGYI